MLLPDMFSPGRAPERPYVDQVVVDIVPVKLDAQPRCVYYYPLGAGVQALRLLAGTWRR